LNELAKTTAVDDARKGPECSMCHASMTTGRWMEDGGICGDCAPARIADLEAQLRQLQPQIEGLQEQARLREIDYWNAVSAGSEDREPECTCTKIDADLLDASGCERHG
jgi:hypothetical protein